MFIRPFFFLYCLGNCPFKSDSSSPKTNTILSLPFSYKILDAILCIYLVFHSYSSRDYSLSVMYG